AEADQSLQPGAVVYAVGVLDPPVRPGRGARFYRSDGPAGASAGEHDGAGGRLARVQGERRRVVLRVRRRAAGRVHGARVAVRVHDPPVDRAAGRAARGDRRARDAAHRRPAAPPGRHDQPVQRDWHGPADRSRDQELDPARGIHQPAQGEGTRHRRRRARIGPHPAATDSHDVGIHDHGGDPGDDRSRRGVHVAAAPRLRDRGRHPVLDGADAVRRSGGVRAAGPTHRAASEPRARGPTGGGRLMLALLAALQFQLQVPAIAMTAVDSLPVVTLPEALRRATGLDPNYVAALGQVDNAVWARRSAFSVFLLPAVAIETDATKNLPQFFNFGTLRPETYAVSAQVTLRYDVFTGGQKVAELTRSAAALDAARAGELQAR